MDAAEAEFDAVALEQNRLFGVGAERLGKPGIALSGWPRREAEQFLFELQAFRPVKSFAVVVWTVLPLRDDPAAAGPPPFLAGFGVSSASASRNECWPAALSRAWAAAPAMAPSMLSKSCLRAAPAESNAPVFTRCSSTRLLSARASTRAVEVGEILERPVRLALLEDLHTAACSPTPLIPARPKAGWRSS